MADFLGVITAVIVVWVLLWLVGKLPELTPRGQQFARVLVVVVAIVYFLTLLVRNL
jgi:low affinity Fe/Cu permease